MKNHDPNNLTRILTEIKTRYGITQTAVAKVLGVSVQALTDMKNGRRIFTPPMAEKLLERYLEEPWADWLAEELNPLINPADESSLPPPDPENMVPVDTVIYLPASRSAPRIPLLRMPFLGNSQVIEDRCERYVELPEWTIPLIPAGSNPYILELAADDYTGRLRIGDWILVVQVATPPREIMLVEHAESIRLARNAAYDVDNAYGHGDWIALDSGLPLPSATPMAMVLGVIMARL